VDKFKRSLFADEAWAALRQINDILDRQGGNADYLHTLTAMRGDVRDVLDYVLRRVD